MKNTLAFAVCALAALTAAAPIEKPSIVWVTDWEEVIETAYVTATVHVPCPLSTVQAASAASTAQATSDAAVLLQQAAAAAAAAATSQAAPAATSDAYTAPAAATSTPAPAVTSAAVQAPVAVAPAAPSSVAVAAPSPTPAFTPAPANTPAPAPSSAIVEAPAPSSAVVKAPAPSAAPAPSNPPASTDSSLGGDHTGEITYYDVGLGSCGITSTAGEAVVALSHFIMTPANGGNPNNNPYCGKKISINYGGKTVPATVVDTCMGCAQDDIDVSDSVFMDVIGDMGLGRVSGVSWSFAS